MFLRLLGLFFIPYLLSANPTLPITESANDIVYVEKVSRFSNLDTNEYYFKVTLNNQQTFELPVTLEDLIDNIIYAGMAFQIVSETFISEDPGFSIFTYTSLNDSIRLSGRFDSVHSHWHPSESQEIITLVDKWAWRSGVSNINYSIRFSDGSGWNIGYELYTSGLFNIGDRFFKIVSNGYLVNVIDGRVITRNHQNRFIKVVW